MVNFRSGAEGIIKGVQKVDETSAGAVGAFIDAITPGPNVRFAEGISNRRSQVMTWRLPNGTGIQMYINPENFQIKESKQINATRTKGGFVVQYWGDNLTELTLSGTTGSSGISGINVLRDIYRSENKAFELVAATQTAELLNTISVVGLSDASTALKTVSDSIQERNFILRPSLASLALSVLLFYQGVQYKGYFTNFSVTESISKLGLFDYNLTFMVTELRGKRENFMPWHKEALADDLAGQLLNGVGNAIRSAIGLSQQAPQQFHPENAPYTFGTGGLLDLINDPGAGALTSSILRGGVLL